MRTNFTFLILSLSLSFNFLVSKSQKNDAIFWGIFEENIQNDIAKVDGYGDEFGKKASIVMWYVGWWNGNMKSFPMDNCNQVSDAGYVPHIVWEPWIGLDTILDGSVDAEIEQFGADIAEFGKPVMIRWGHEFNGDWYPWSYKNNAVVPASKWIQTYKYVHDKVVAAGATNAIWLWSPNNGNGGKNPQDIALYYPGDNYVDWIAIDGYNWGTSQNWSTWQSFAGVFGTTYTKVKKYPKPVMIGEFGCANTGGNKALWIKDLFNQVKNNYPRIKAFIWFNVNKETDWRFNSTTESNDAFKLGLSDTIVSEDISKLENLHKTFNTSIKTGTNDKFEVFPNPAIDIITLKSKNEIKSDIVIYNALGIKMLEIKSNFEKERNIDIRSLKKGVYFITFKNTTSLFLKQ